MSAARIEGLIPAIRKSFISSVLSIVIFGALLAPYSPTGFATWLAIRALASLGSLVVLRRLSAPAEQPEATIRILTLVMAVSGVVWGLIPLLVRPTEPEWRAVVVLWLFGNQAVVTAVCSSSRPVFRAAIGSVTLVGALGSLAYGDLFGLILAGLLVLGGVYSQSIFGAMHLTVSTAIEARLEASSLAASLAVQQQRLKAANEALTQLANRDDLTALLNRRRFVELLVDGESNMIGDGWLAYLDLDRFKVINDSHGHAAGDQVLEVAAERWKEALPATGVLARTGGDEFAAWFTASSPDEARVIVQRLNQCLRSPIALAGQLHVLVSCSIGVTEARAGASFAAAAAQADQALYLVKDQGGNGVKIWDQREPRSHPV